jgi:hypothetical protein
MVGILCYAFYADYAWVLEPGVEGRPVHNESPVIQHLFTGFVSASRRFFQRIFSRRRRLARMQPRAFAK